MNDVGIDELAAAIAQAQDRRLADDRSRRLLGVREALLADPRVAAPESRPTWLTAVVALAVVAVLAVGAGLWLRAPDRAPLTFTVGDESLARVEALWIAAPAAPIDVAFSDGSQLVLAQGSRARIDTATHATGRVVLESGGIAVEVGEGMLVDAGPFALALADVECEVAWDGTAQRLGVVVQRGRVHVSGPGDQAHDVVAGQRIEISPRATQLAVAASLTPVAPVTAPIAAPIAESQIEPNTVTRSQARRRGAPAAS
ncbi:MAG: hypothetical protein IAG13_28245, partial [Deltaproteobacteria bacterium]|nr:hypothetical protein [Nannocystaceae bacterium]